MIAAVGVVVIVGWISGVTVLTSVAPTLVSMKFDTAVGFVLAGLSVSAVADADRSPVGLMGRLAALVYGFLGLATLVEYAVAHDLGFDNPFGFDTVGPNPGRMAPTTAACFVALAVSVLAFDRQRTRTGQLAGLMVVVAAWLAVIGYAFGVMSLYDVGDFTPMALNTAVGFVIAGSAILFARPDQGFVALMTGNNASGVTVRRLLAPALIVPMVVGVVLEWAARARMFTPHFRSAVFTIAMMVFAGMLIWIVGATLRHVDLRRAGAEDAFELVNRALTEREQALELLRRSEDHTRRIIETTGDAFVSIDDGGLVDGWNRAAEEMFGWPRGEALGRALDELIIPAGMRVAHRAGLARIAAGGPSKLGGQTLDLTAIRRDGSEISVELKVWAIDTDGQRHFNAFVRDVSARKAIEEALAASEESFRVTQHNVPIGLALVSLDGRFLQVNPALCELVGRAEDDLLTRTFQDLSHPDDLTASVRLIDIVLRDEHHRHQMEKRYLRPDGHVVWVLLSVALVRVSGEPHHFVSTMLDITDRKLDDAELETAASTDTLTGAFNRRHLDAELDALCAAAQRHDDPIAVLMIDIDHFKNVNDRHGHPTGDRVLTLVTQRLQRELRAEDILGRWGGEEFLVVLPRTDRLGALAIAERLRAAVADEAVPLADAGAVPVTISVGVAAGRGLDPDGLIARADRALYDAKTAGRNRVAVDSVDDHPLTLARACAR